MPTSSKVGVLVTVGDGDWLIDSEAYQDEAAAVDRAAEYLEGKSVKGGPGSGNFGHSGRPGKVGGSAPKSGKLHDITETPEFKAWFGDSKIVDENGKPLVVYHNTYSKNIDQFLPLADIPDSNLDRSAEAAVRFRQMIKDNKRISPFAFRRGTFFTPTDQYRGYGPERYAVYIKAENPFYMDMTTSETNVIHPDKPIDAFIYMLKGKIQEISVLLPEQVKSVDNEGTFDPNNFSIFKEALEEQLKYTLKGGPGSGNHGHAGRPGKVGGSQPRGYNPDFPEENTAFKKWFGKSKVVDENGDPQVVYHGTTHEFTQFGGEYGNPENFLGVAHYFTNSAEDVSENYAGMGPDLTKRIEMEAERIYEQRFESGDEEVPDFGSDEYEKAMEEAKAEAMKLIAGEHEGAVMPVYLKMENPIKLLGPWDSTQFYIEEEMDEDGEYTGEKSGNGLQLYEAIKEAGWDYDFDGEEVWAKLSEDVGWWGDGVSADKVDQSLRENQELNYVQDDNGNLVIGNVIRDIYKNAGFDGAILDAYKQFGPQQMSFGRIAGMPHMSPGDIHYVVWDANQIKALFNQGTFDPNDPDILKERLKQWFEVGLKGGPGSGNHGHAGRPGKRGGSRPRDLGADHVYPETGPAWVMARRGEESARLLDFHPESQKLVWVRPMTYFAVLREDLGQSNPAVLRKYINEDSVSKLTERMKNRQPIDAAFIDINLDTGKAITQEGRHRALAAYDLGIKEIPVILYFRQGGGYVDIRRGKNKALAEKLDPFERPEYESYKGGAGSGHWGHSGRPGKVGGSAPATAAFGIGDYGERGKVLERLKVGARKRRDLLRKKFRQRLLEDDRYMAIQAKIISMRQELAPVAARMNELNKRKDANRAAQKKIDDRMSEIMHETNYMDEITLSVMTSEANQLRGKIEELEGDLKGETNEKRRNGMRILLENRKERLEELEDARTLVIEKRNALMNEYLTIKEKQKELQKDYVKKFLAPGSEGIELDRQYDQLVKDYQGFADGSGTEALTRAMDVASELRNKISSQVPGQVMEKQVEIYKARVNAIGQELIQISMDRDALYKEVDQKESLGKQWMSQEIFDRDYRPKLAELGEREDALKIESRELAHLAAGAAEVNNDEKAGLFFKDNPGNITYNMTKDAKMNAGTSIEHGMNWVNKVIGRNPLMENYPVEFEQLGPNEYRAHAGDNVVSLSKLTFIPTVVHEMGHILEERDPLIGRLAQNFLAERTQGEKAQPLKDLVPFSTYRPDEIAKKDKFIEPYMGKIYKYSDGESYATEITSMGLSKTGYQDSGYELMQNDPEYWDFLYAVLNLGHV